MEGNNKTYPCYLLTRKGCHIVANRMTGKKGVLFTLAYVNRYNEMEQILMQQQPQPKFKLPQTMSEALRSAADQADENQTLLLKVESNEYIRTERTSNVGQMEN